MDDRERARVTAAFREHGDLREIANHAKIDTIMVEGALDFGIVALDVEGRIASWSAGAQELTGYLPDEVDGHHWDLLATEEDRAARIPLADLQRAALEGVSATEGYLRRRDGSTFWAMSRLRALVDVDGNLRGYVRLFRDATERHEAQLVAAAAHTNLKQFQAMVAHELRNPMTPILIHLAILREGGPDGIQRSLETIERSFRRLQRLATDLAEASLLESPKFALDLRDTPMAPLLRQAVEFLKPSAEEAGVTLRHACPREWAHCDGERIAQVLHNVLANALRFTPRGGTITLALRAVGERAVVSVTDTGSGMSEQAMQRLFKPFSQVGPDAGRDGMGLGLYLSQRIVQAHGGAIWAQSPGTGKGTTICFTLPRARAPRPGRSRKAST